MVALNWQTYDLGVQLNDAMFAAPHDDTGYVLKPKCLRGPRTSFDPPADAAAALRGKKDKKEVSFSIDVISAQQLPRPKDHKSDESINPFIEVEVFSADDKTKGTSTGEGGTDMSETKGMSGLGAPQKRRTKAVKDDGFHPQFREKMRFSLVTKFEDLVFVRFSVYNQEGGDDKALMATYTAKLMSLQQGEPPFMFVVVGWLVANEILYCQVIAIFRCMIPKASNSCFRRYLLKSKSTPSCPSSRRRATRRKRS